MEIECSRDASTFAAYFLKYRSLAQTMKLLYHIQGITLSGTGLVLFSDAIYSGPEGPQIQVINENVNILRDGCPILLEEDYEKSLVNFALLLPDDIFNVEYCHKYE